ncbi:CDP-alcohol phosphatidyltransferase family protein [Mesorhizobium sp. CAU 1732]|uniref:CDP-alcohol phosphatidyltransferase family protein n=1 Tax=Mesorhizobium sp. CAU 1732 TaxID=3140358 RepID=UPI0032606DD1
MAHPFYRFLLIGFGNAALLAALATWLAPSDGKTAVVAAVAVYGIGIVIAAFGLLATYSHRELGLANAVTQLRAALGAALIVPLAVPGMMPLSDDRAWAALAIAATALALDGVDGWLARRSALISSFGARFDMEVDALLALVLSVLALQNGKAGAWVLILGMMRYLFVIAGWALPWLQTPLPESLRRKVICVVQIGTLVVLLAPTVQSPVSTVLAAAAAILLVWSFAVDVVWLARNRRT